MRTTAIALLLLAAAPLPALAQTPSPGPGQPPSEPIEDNSFLLEEAYNQGPGVVQHISIFQSGRSGGWEYSFTQEWPLRSQRHQLSYDVTLLDPGGLGAGLGDLQVNYRMQLLGIGGGRVAFAPRLTAILPTGDEDGGYGAGAAGVQANLPLSVRLSSRFAAHTNTGLTHTGEGEGGGGATTTWSAGQSVIWLARPDLNVMLEGVWERADAPGGEEESLYLSPGVRMAVDLPSGLQVVPGIAVPIGVGPSDGDWSVLLYLSLEHPFSRRGR